MGQLCCYSAKDRDGERGAGMRAEVPSYTRRSQSVVPVMVVAQERCCENQEDGDKEKNDQADHHRFCFVRTPGHLRDQPITSLHICGRRFQRLTRTKKCLPLIAKHYHGIATQRKRSLIHCTDLCKPCRTCVAAHARHAPRLLDPHT
eukprot:CAMPEP_0181212800 /NCGR_PEP_ID=MMETSP1096-20121128/24552_1 /TAXON_ID=156174 ORGANISM="Chrysochromulina ericina, Strain CCMP281" /NCGR_SAMPLE_ID=MMETSP1096 /ASSEMBLY_ACC=CAM_ASM_000453 /LENGTH=146 /DNA_ID=CAMNT_0023304371 /DNA_START=407 /DNA_END=847 /DNA_ORIENTATION=-